MSSLIICHHNKKDLYFIAYGNCDQAYTYWKNKGVQKSLDLQIVKAKNRVENAKMELKLAENDFEKLLKLNVSNAAETKRIKKLEKTLQDMLNVYEELHSIYDIGDCDVTENARKLLQSEI